MKRIISQATAMVTALLFGALAFVASAAANPGAGALTSAVKTQAHSDIQTVGHYGKRYKSRYYRKRKYRGHKRRKHSRRHYRNRHVHVDAPFTRYSRHRGHVAVDAPFAMVRRSRRGVYVRAPFVDLYIPRY